MKLIKLTILLFIFGYAPVIQPQPQPDIRVFPPVMDRMRNLQVVYNNVDSVGMDTTIHTFNFEVKHQAFIGMTRVDSLIWTYTDKGVNDFGEIVVQFEPDTPRLSDVSGKRGNISYRWMTFEPPWSGVIKISFGKGKRVTP